MFGFLITIKVVKLNGNLILIIVLQNVEGQFQ